MHEHPRTFVALNFRAIRTGIAAGSPIPIELMKKLISKLNLRDLTNAYGMSAFFSCPFPIPFISMLSPAETRCVYSGSTLPA